jgi:hypothetical protein
VNSELGQFKFLLPTFTPSHLPAFLFIPTSEFRPPTSDICPLSSEPLYETTPSWNSEPQNIEQEISNDEVWNRCAQSFFKNNESIPYFDIRYSLFDIRYSLFQSFSFD